MAGPLSLPLISLNRNCAHVILKQKMQWSAKSTACFLKPNTYPVCRRRAIGMTGQKAAMIQIKKFNIRGYHREPEKVALAETIQTDMNRLKETMAEQEEKVNALKQILAHRVKEIDRLKETVDGLVNEMNHMNSRVEKREKKFERLSGIIQSAWSDYDMGIGAVAEERPTNADAHRENKRKRTGEDIV